MNCLLCSLSDSPRLTADLDITPSRTPGNLDRLAGALRDLDARVYTDAVPEGLPFDCAAAMLARADLWHLVTSAGRLDIAFEPAGTKGFDDLSRGAVRFAVYGTEILAASLGDIMRSKRAADRPQDRQDVVIIREMLRNRVT